MYDLSATSQKTTFFIIKLLLNVVTAEIEALIVSGNKFLQTGGSCSKRDHGCKKSGQKTPR
jgi:hypothetical protein